MQFGAQGQDQNPHCAHRDSEAGTPKPRQGTKPQRQHGSHRAGCITLPAQFPRIGHQQERGRRSNHRCPNQGRTRHSDSTGHSPTQRQQYECANSRDTRPLGLAAQAPAALHSQQQAYGESS